MIKFGAKDFEISIDQITISGSVVSDNSYAGSPIDKVLLVKAKLSNDLFKKAKSKNDGGACLDVIISCYSFALRQAIGLDATSAWPFSHNTKKLDLRASGGVKTLEFSHHLSLPAYKLYGIGLDQISGYGSGKNIEDISFDPESMNKRLRKLSELAKDYLSIRTRVFQRSKVISEEKGLEDSIYLLRDEGNQSDKDLFEDYIGHEISKTSVMTYSSKEEIFELIENY